jgi:small subunit ribosomal protein S16
MLKLRLKKIGRKRQPSYRIIIIPNTSRRDGKALDEVGYYNPITKEISFNSEKIVEWLKNGVQPTATVKRLLQKAKILEV